MRIILIVLDSLGIGELPDAAEYGDEGSNTLLNIKKKVPNMNLKNLNILGLSSIDGVEGLEEGISASPIGAYCRIAEASKGKDTTIGHWEIAGVITRQPFPTFPDGFPKEIIGEFEQKTGKKIIGNYASSGTEILTVLGCQHMTERDNLIVYTSADSVFQIAAHEDIVPVEELYRFCEIARKMLTGEGRDISRVIARPFIGQPGNFNRTANRKDFSLPPPKETMLDYIKAAGLEVAAVGKIEDIFSGKGITQVAHTSGNLDGIDKTLAYMDTIRDGLIFTNLVDFDMLYGHRNDFQGYAYALAEFDSRLPEITARLKEDDLLIITADHGCDPTTPSTDHSREYIPLIAYGRRICGGKNLHTRSTFADIAATVLDYLNISGQTEGRSFLGDILRKDR